MVIPSTFNAHGRLPPGEHLATLEELRESLLVLGPPGITEDDWDAAWRRHLVENVSILVPDLWSVGIDEVFLDGSFVTDKPRPGDVDGFFRAPRREQARMLSELVRLRPEWDVRQRRLDSDGKPKPLMWHRFRVEFYPGWYPAMRRPPQTYNQFFRRTRDRAPKGVVKIVKSEE